MHFFPMTDASKTELKSWISRNIATVLLTITIALSSLVWSDLVGTMEKMRVDIQELTGKINEVVVNQARQENTIQDNRSDIKDIKRRLNKQQGNWERQWRRNSNNNN